MLGIQPGDSLLFFSDGAVEFTEVDGQRVGRDGLEKLLRKAGYPGSATDFGAIEAEMLAASDRIRFEDDVTFIDVRIC